MKLYLVFNYECDNPFEKLFLSKENAEVYIQSNEGIFYMEEVIPSDMLVLEKQDETHHYMLHLTATQHFTKEAISDNPSVVKSVTKKNGVIPSGYEQVYCNIDYKKTNKGHQALLCLRIPLGDSDESAEKTATLLVPQMIKWIQTIATLSQTKQLAYQTERNNVMNQMIPEISSYLQKHGLDPYA